MEKKKSMVRAECRELMVALEAEHTKSASYAEGPQRTEALKRVAKLASRTTNHLEQSRLYSVQYKVSGWEARCCDFLLLPIASYCFLLLLASLARVPTL